MIAGKDYSDDTAIADHKPRILGAAIKLRERFNKDDDDDFDSGDETTYQEVFTQIP